MKNSVAYVVKRMCEISGQPPVKKTLQKIVYLIEEKGIDLHYNYILHFYGPYCSELDADTLELSTEGVLNFTYTAYGHRISVPDDLDIEPGVTPGEQVLIDSLLERYKDWSPSTLELLATAIYAYRHTDSKSKDRIVTNVRKIKGEKYSSDRILMAIDEFPEFNIKLSA